MKDKILHDTVHGNIRIPESYCSLIIDTLLFQRLRRVEQSSVRSLYPCARHDRFIHSIGVFYIGSMVVEWLYSNIDEELSRIGIDVGEDMNEILKYFMQRSIHVGTRLLSRIRLHVCFTTLVMLRFHIPLSIIMISTSLRCSVINSVRLLTMRNSGGI